MKADKRDGGARQAAKQSGSLTYFTGRPCKNGHVANRQTSNGCCVECRPKIRKKFYDANREAMIRRTVEYHKAHPEWSKQQDRSYYRRHKEEHAAAGRIWKEENRDKVRALHRNRKARKKQNGGSHTGADILDILRMQKSKCACCRVSLKKMPYHVDHIIPLSKGGGNDRRNLQILCVDCNLEKSALDPHVFMRRKGKLL